MELKLTVSTKGKFFEGKAPEIILSQREAFLHKAAMYLEGLVKKYTPTGVYGAAGGLLSTIHGEVVEKGVKAVVGHGSVYGDVIEKGRTAGKAWPPEGVLLSWIEKKLGVDGVQAKGLEFVIRRKIGRKGFPGAHMFEKAFTEGYSTIVSMANNMGFEIAKELNE